MEQLLDSPSPPPYIRDAMLLTVIRSFLCYVILPPLLHPLLRSAVYICLSKQVPWKCLSQSAHLLNYQHKSSRTTLMRTQMLACLPLCPLSAKPRARGLDKYFFAGRKVFLNRYKTYRRLGLEEISLLCTLERQMKCVPSTHDAAGDGLLSRSYMSRPAEYFVAISCILPLRILETIFFS